MGSTRTACLLLPLFPLAARLRSEPELTREALAVMEGNGNAARVVAATRLARSARPRPGRTPPPPPLGRPAAGPHPAAGARPLPQAGGPAARRRLRAGGPGSAAGGGG